MTMDATPCASEPTEGDAAAWLAQARHLLCAALQHDLFDDPRSSHAAELALAWF